MLMAIKTDCSQGLYLIPTVEQTTLEDHRHRRYEMEKIIHTKTCYKMCKTDTKPVENTERNTHLWFSL